jgi:hypothetical protein
MDINTEYKNVICPDCGNNNQIRFHVIIDFGEEFGEVKFGCMECYEMFILSYNELEKTK